MSRSNTGAAGAKEPKTAVSGVAAHTDALHVVTPGQAGQQVPTDGADASGTETVRRVRVNSPQRLLATVPWLLRFQPSRCIVVIGTEPRRGEVKVTLRYSLPDPADAKAAARIAQHTADFLSAQGITRAVAAGYGPDGLVRPLAIALRQQLHSDGIAVGEVLRAEDGRYWSYICDDPECCPPEGTPFDPDPSSVSEVFAGVTVLESREALAATLEPVGGDGAALMRRALRAAERDARSLTKAAAGMPRRMAREATAGPGLQSVQAAIDLYRAGGELDSPEEAARLLAALRSDLWVRDDGWSRMEAEHAKAHLQMWTDLTRLAPRGYAAPPASLLAFTAWQLGDGALANVALDRALADTPDYSMASLIRDALDAGAPPSMARLPMTPELVADSYLMAAEAEDHAEKAGVETM